MNPLIEKFEEVYGKKPKEGGLIEQLAEEQLGAAGSPDVIKVGDTVIPTAEVTPTGINLTGAYIDTSALIANSFTMPTCNAFNTPTSSQKTYTLPNQTSAEQQFCKVMDNVANGKAIVASISAEIDRSFTGFGGQIRYTVEIVGRYP